MALCYITSLYSAWRWIYQPKHVTVNYLKLQLIKAVFDSVITLFNTTGIPFLKSFLFCIAYVHKFSKNIGTTSKFQVAGRWTKSKIHTECPQILGSLRISPGDLATKIYASPALMFIHIVYPATECCESHRKCSKYKYQLFQFLYVAKRETV